MIDGPVYAGIGRTFCQVLRELCTVYLLQTTCNCIVVVVSSDRTRTTILCFTVRSFFVVHVQNSWGVQGVVLQRHDAFSSRAVLSSWMKHEGLARCVLIFL